MIKAITYNYFCVLGGLKNPRCSTRAIYNGKWFMYTEYYYNFSE